MIYFDNAATTLQKPEEVAQAVKESFSYIGNAGRGANEASLFTSRLIFQTRKQIAELFHMKDGEQSLGAERVVFTMNATESLNIVLKGLLHPGDHVITTEMEHNSVLRPLYELEEKGIGVTIVFCEKNGTISCEKIKQAIGKNTKAIVCTHASNVTGDGNDIAQIGTLCEKYNLYFILDASQTAGSLPIDVQKMGLDVLCFTGHKGLMGPQGTGGLYVRQGVKINPLKVGGSGIHSFDHDHPKAMPEHLEAGTLNVHGIAGLGGALNYLSEIGTEAIIKKERSLIKRLEDQIRDLPNIHLYGNSDSSQRVGILSFNMGDEDSAYVADWLFEEEEIAVRSGAHCAPLMHETLGTKMQGAVRISVSHKNTEEEIDRTANAIKKLSQLLE